MADVFLDYDEAVDAYDRLGETYYKDLVDSEGYLALVGVFELCLWERFTPDDALAPR